MTHLNKNIINYKKFINQLCDFKSLEVNSTLQQVFLKTFLVNFRFMSLSNKNGLYYLHYDLLGLPQHSVFLKKSGLARAQINQLNHKYTTPLVSTDARTLQFLRGLDMPESFKTKHYIQLRDLLMQKRGLNILWNDGSVLKHLLFWEQVYAPGLIALQGFSNWHAFFLKEREWFFFSSWARREVNYILMLILISRGFSNLFNHYMPLYVIKELHGFLKETGPLFDNKNRLAPFYMWTFDILRWSSFLNGGLYSPQKIILSEKNKLKVEEFIYDEDILYFGGWMQAHQKDLIREIRYWVYPQIDEFKNEELFEELTEMEDVYDTDIIDDDAFIESCDIFVWPWTKFWDQYQALDFMKSRKFFSEVNYINEQELLLSFYFSVNDLNQRLAKTPTSNDLLIYFEQTFRTSAWDDVLKWFNFFYPKTFNTVQLIGFNRLPLLLFLSFIISRINGLFLYGFQGFDRRNIFFRLFFFLVLKHRGFCFKWFSILLRKVVYKLPWQEELVYVLHILEQDQLFFQNVCKKKLYSYFFMEDELLAIRIAGNNPFLYFFQFFFKNYWSKLVLQKRQELYPDFIQKVESLIFKNPDILKRFVFKVTVHIYIALLLDFIRNPMSFVRYVRLFEAKLDSKMPRVFDIDLENYGKDHKGGSYFSFFKYQKKFENLLQETVYKNKFRNTTTEGYLNGFLLRKQLRLTFDVFKMRPKTWRTTLFLFFFSYKQFYIYVLNILKQAFSVFIAFLISGFVSNVAYKLSEYHLKLFSLHFSEWPKYKEEVKTIFHIGLKKDFKQNSAYKRKFLFFRRWWLYLSSFRRVFRFNIILSFLLKVCWFYMLRAIYRILLNLYKVFWRRVFIYRRWLWRIQNTAKLRFYDWSPDLDRSILRGISRETKILEARDRSKAKDSSDQPLIVVYLKEKIDENDSPFKDELWREIYKWLISLFFYRKLRRKSVVFKRRLTYMFGKTNEDRVIKVLLNFRFWSFFFTYVYLFLMRSALLSISFFFFTALNGILNIIFIPFSIYCKLDFGKFIKSFFLQIFVVLYSFFYGFTFLSIYVLSILFFFVILFFKLFKWVFMLFLYFSQWFGFSLVILPFMKALIWMRYLFTDLWLNLKFNWYWFLIFFFSWWSFVRFVVLITLGFFLFLLVTVWYTLKGAFFNKMVKKDYTTTLFFLFKEESSIFYYDFKDFFFFISFFFKSFCLILSFFMFLIGQMGWKLVKFIFGEGYESDALKIKPELPTKKVFQFLDLYVKIFFFNLRELCLMKSNFFFFIVYCLSLELFTLFLRGLHVFFFVCIFSFNFFFFLFEKTRIHRILIRLWRVIFLLISLMAGSLKLYIRAFKLKPIFNIIYAGVSLRLWNRDRKKQNRVLSLPILFLLKISSVLFNDKFLKLSLNFIKPVFKTSWLKGTLFAQQLLYKKFKPQEFSFKRDLQEIVVFIILIYEFSSFYWAYLQKLSIEVGQLGWWLSYYNRYRKKLSDNFRKDSGFYHYSKQDKQILLKKRTTTTSITLFSKDHSYYLHLNDSFPAVQRYKPYIINKIYVEKEPSIFRNSGFFGKFLNAGTLFKRIGSFLGLSFLFEILFLRFQQPISIFLFGDKEKLFPAHTLMRLNYFKDFFSELNWLIRFTYIPKITGWDHFLLRYLPRFFRKLSMQSDYLEKDRAIWFYKVFPALQPRVVDLLPKFRWNYFNLFIKFFKSLILLSTFIFCLLFIVILVSSLVHLLFYFILFHTIRVIVFWFYLFFKRFGLVLLIGSSFFMLLVLYTLGFFFF